MSWLKKIFAPSAGKKPTAPADQTIGDDFKPAKGTFFRTLEFPETDAAGNITGKTWMESGFVPDNNAWTLWQKSIRQTEDVLRGGTATVLSARPLFERTSFASAYDQMTTFETAQRNMGFEPLAVKTRAKLGGDYYKQFAWREGLMMTRSGRLYPYSAQQVNGPGHFDAQDIADANAFLERTRNEQFVPVPIVLPAVDWEKAYEARKDITDRRLNVLYHRYNGDKNDFDLALQIVGQEMPEILFAHLRRGGNPKIFETDPTRHIAIINAALDRGGADVMELLAESGLSFAVRDGADTPVELAISKKRYAHLHIMLSRDGVALANFTDAAGIAPAIHAMETQDRQAFRMLYLEGLDYAAADKDGWHLVHHAFANNFLPGVYAWTDEGLPIDMPVNGAPHTGLSIARARGHAALADFAVKNGANPAAPDLAATPAIAADPAPAAPMAAPAPTAPVPAFTPDLLNSDLDNDTIIASATAHHAAGGTFTALDSRSNALFELCWKNRKDNDPSRDRRNLITVFAGLGADPAARLDDGTTTLTRAASGMALDMDYINTLAPFAGEVNAGDDQGNNILHALQLNRHDAVGHSNNIAALLKTFPALDINRANADGYSNVGLAIRLNRSQTLKAFAAGAPDLSLATKSGISYLTLAFTAACADAPVAGAARAATIKATSDAVRDAVVTILEQPGANRSAVTDTLLGTMVKEQAPEALIRRLTALKP